MFQTLECAVSIWSRNAQLPPSVKLPRTTGVSIPYTYILRARADLSAQRYSLFSCLPSFIPADDVKTYLDRACAHQLVTLTDSDGCSAPSPTSAPALQCKLPTEIVYLTYNEVSNGDCILPHNVYLCGRQNLCIYILVTNTSLAVCQSVSISLLGSLNTVQDVTR